MRYNRSPFLLAMNGDCDLGARAFAQLVIGVADKARNGENFSTCVGKLVRHIIPYCLKKINRRRGKIANRLAEMTAQKPSNVSTTFDPKMLQAFNKANGYKDGPSVEMWPSWVKNWFDRYTKHPLKQTRPRLDFFSHRGLQSLFVYFI